MGFVAPSAPISNNAANPASFAWPVLFVLLAGLGGVGLLLPWFRLALNDVVAQDYPATHSWNALIFVLAPVLMVLTAVAAIQSRTDPAAMRKASKLAILAGLLLGVSVTVGWVRGVDTYRDADEFQTLAAESGVTLGVHPQIGVYLCAVSAVLYVLIGVVARLKSRSW